ncbi:pyridoxamine 5'-phosphate oxidase family protein [Streptomyces broussonetiae]|uniref:Helix-turn-helix domain-containing protein n=1 Tax=Streptomyces broussonetiae TaxID=2686304 RepID=A0A6I6MR20_9ACTN|nr:pyridoxamine 5'-phosphate oxidase family protein [Streptomyces broussonetiae]QHA02958.1 helix-turn-helix domain-containing protein [Streptomyces broussonetiae]
MTLQGLGHLLREATEGGIQGRAPHRPGIREVAGRPVCTMADAKGGTGGRPVRRCVPRGRLDAAGSPGDIGRRMAAERRRQRLSRRETAGRARMSPDYLAYLEERPSAPGTATLIRPADALGTTVAALRGGGIDLPPGQGQALLHPRLQDLSPEECRTRLSTHGVGRVAVSTPESRPAVLPVHYEVVDDAIVFRTPPGSVPAAAAAATEVAFELDHVDDALSRGWSVLAVGPANVVTDPATARGLTRRAHTTSWAGGDREMWVSIRPTSLTGRRITPADH